MWMRGKFLLAAFWIGLLSSGLVLSPGAAQPPRKPLSLPVALPPGPSTWLFGQPYGNTVGAYNFGDAWYSAGQGLHFGIDLPMPCGTPLVAMADGVVAFVDNFGFGSRPHNLLIRHPDLNLTILYGHLLERPPMVEGQAVQRGQEVGLSGDPDGTCDSRPHLHLEVRSLDYRTTYNPITYIDANWHSLALFGSYSYPLFQQDLTNPRRWMSLDDQPNVSFGGQRLNDYLYPNPPASGNRAPQNPPLARTTELLTEPVPWQLRQLTSGGCCPRPWWSPTNPDRIYIIDGVPGDRAAIFGWSAETSAQVELVGQAPENPRSPDGTHEILRAGGQVNIWRLGDGANWSVPTQGAVPAISADNSRLMWVIRAGVSLPGEDFTRSDIWISDLNGGSPRQIISEPGASALWLDDARLLVSTPGDGRQTTLSIYDTRDDSRYTLGTWTWLRHLSIAPGGERVMFFITQQPDPARNGVYTVSTTPDAQAELLPWFGSWRWRDSDSVYYIPYDVTTEAHRLAYYHIPSGIHFTLTDPAAQRFTIANADWDVSADGRRIVFQNAVDGNLWLLEPTG